jgi:hypothetical protein
VSFLLTMALKFPNFLIFKEFMEYTF